MGAFEDFLNDIDRLFTGVALDLGITPVTLLVLLLVLAAVVSALTSAIKSASPAAAIKSASPAALQEPPGFGWWQASDGNWYPHEALGAGDVQSFKLSQPPPVPTSDGYLASIIPVDENEEVGSLDGVTFDVMLTEVGESRDAVLAGVRALANLDLPKGKELVDHTPRPVMLGVEWTVAKQAKSLLVDAGGSVIISRSSQ